MIGFSADQAQLTYRVRRFECRHDSCHQLIFRERFFQASDIGELRRKGFGPCKASEKYEGHASGLKYFCNRPYRCATEADVEDRDVYLIGRRSLNSLRDCCKRADHLAIGQERSRR